MALKDITNIYSIQLPNNGSVAPQSLNSTVSLEAGDVVALEDYTGDAGGYAVTSGCRIILDSNTRSGYITNRTVAQVKTLLT